MCQSLCASRPCSCQQTSLITCRLIYTLRQYPATEDFVYLVQAPASTPGEPNPYALDVVPFATLRADPALAADYYTLSVRGMTRYVGGENAEFTSERGLVGRAACASPLYGQMLPFFAAHACPCDLCRRLQLCRP